MPIPTFDKFDDPSAGTPRRPVPVRFACLAANWPPVIFACAVTGDAQLGPPLLQVWDYDEATGRPGAVHAATYDGLIKAGASLPEALAAMPSNHFVWSNELCVAFSDFVDLTIGRESAREAGLGIQWNPALNDCSALISECSDFAKLIPEPPSSVRLAKTGNAWLASFDGVDAPVKHSIGLYYIYYLLLRPKQQIQVSSLSELATPSNSDIAAELHVPSAKLTPEPNSGSATSCDYIEEIETGAIATDVDALETPEIPIHGGLGNAGLTYDDEAIKSIKAHLSALDVRIQSALEKGHVDLATRLEREKTETAKYLRAGRNKRGAARIIGSTHEKIRKAVSNAVERAIDAIAVAHPALGAHLDASITRGANFCYIPDYPANNN